MNNIDIIKKKSQFQKLNWNERASGYNNSKKD